MAETYASLSAMLAVLVDRDPVQDTDFASALPSLFERAERRIVRDLNLAPATQLTQGTMTMGIDTIPYLPGMTSTVTLEIDLPTGVTKTLLWQSLAFVRRFWTSTTATDEPRYCAVKSSSTVQIAPTPNLAYAYRWFTRRHINFLTALNQSNFLAEQYPDLLIASLCRQAAIYAIDDRREALRATWESEYQALKVAVANGEQAIGISQYQSGEHIEQGEQAA